MSLTHPDAKGPDSSINLDLENEDKVFEVVASLNRSVSVPQAPQMTRGLAPRNAAMNLANMVRLVETMPMHSHRYFKSRPPIVKKQIYIHHTAGWGDPATVIHDWNTRTGDEVGTWSVIGGRKKHRLHQADTDGVVYRAFSSADWAWHLGVSSPNSEKLNQQSIGVELCSFGPLRKLPTGLFGPINPRVSARFTADEVMVYDASNGFPDGFRGFHFYEKYTPAQLEALRNVLVYLCATYGITPEFKGMEMFDETPRPINEEPGIWTHVSVRPADEKWDCHPQPELIQMLQSLQPMA